MRAKGLVGALALAGLSLALNGCIAAAAIPVVAGGTILQGTVGQRERSAPAQPAPIAETATPVAADTSVRLLPITELPPPGPAAGTAPAAYEAFRAYASAQSLRDPVDDPRASAILAAPGSLAPETTECSILPPAVLVDLDPGDAVADPAAIAADSALAEALASLRLDDVAVFWISGASAGEAGTLRTRLRATGLDPEGHDGLLLMRRPEDRKQLRRKELAETNCVVAILGDERSDFDELFTYLKNPSAAVGLDALIGKGWFLTSPPPSKED